MKFILDTNGYRNLVHGLTTNEIKALAVQIKEAESKNGHTSALSIIVSMELIKHLLPSDNAKKDCYNALCLQWHHTAKLNKSGSTGSYYPPMDVILTKHFFGDNSRYLQLYLTVLELVKHLAHDFDGNNCLRNEEDIKTVIRQLNFETTGMRNNLESYLRSINGGILDWAIVWKNKTLQKKFVDSLKDGRMEMLLANSLMVRAHQLLEKTEMEQTAVDKFPDFVLIYKAALVMNCSILRSVSDGNENLADINDKLWNTINDVQIMFGLLFPERGDQKVLVTEEGKIINAAKAAGVESQVIRLADYRKAIGI